MGCTRTAAVIAGTAMLGMGATGGRAADEGRRTLWNPAPDSRLRDMSTDRPDKTESPYTVDAGRIQVETDLIGYTADSRGRVTTRTFDILPFNLKFGLTGRTELQLVYGGYSHVRTFGGGMTDKETGFGDLTVRVKHNIWGNDGGRTALAVMPFLEVPTNSVDSLNDDVEGGIIVPLAIDLGRGMGLGLMTEVDILRTEYGCDYQPTFVNSASLGFDLTEKWGMYAEAYVARSAESGAETVATLNSGVTYAVDDDLQLDAGANIGVTKAADDLSIFVGLSRRY